MAGTLSPNAQNEPTVSDADREQLDRYVVPFLDWLACAGGGWDEPAATACRALGDGSLERVISVATAGHVLDFDDTYRPGVVHLSAPTAPTALILGAELDRSVADVVAAYSAGFEVMASMSIASGPPLYERGWHPTAVCGVVGSAVAAATLLALDADQQRSAIALALLRAGGLREAFGSDGKALQVGMAAGAGSVAARLADKGVTAPLSRIAGSLGFEVAYGAPVELVSGPAAIGQNWLKPWPCCLQTHPAISAAIEARDRGVDPRHRVTVKVHPFAREAARFDDVTTGLQAKFSIPYMTAFTLLYGPPEPDSLRRVDGSARMHARDLVRVETDPALGESEAMLITGDRVIARVDAPLGSPELPMSAGMLWSKVEGLVGDRLDGALQPDRPVRALIRDLGFD